MIINFSRMFDCVKIKKVYFVFLILLSVIAIVLGVITAINFGGGVFAINIDHISYIKYLKDDCGFGSLIINMVLSLSVFCFIMLFCNYKKFLMPIALIFYFYLIYSQVVIFVSVILVYGFFNCIIFAILLLIYDILIWSVFLLLMLEFSCVCGDYNYVKRCFSFKESKVLIFLAIIIALIIVFSLILMILKSYVVLLIY